MNTRGLMELIALNIGYDMGILSLAYFHHARHHGAGDDFMTGPLVTLFGRGRESRGLAPAPKIKL